MFGKAIPLRSGSHILGRIRSGKQTLNGKLHCRSSRMLDGSSKISRPPVLVHLTCTPVRSLFRGCKPSKFLNTKRHAVQIFYKVLLCGIIVQRRFCAGSMQVSLYLFLVCL